MTAYNFDPIERAQEHLKDINERLEQLQRNIAKLTAAAEREEKAKLSYLDTLEQELNTDPAYCDAEISAILCDTGEAIDNRLYYDYYADIERYKEAIGQLKADRDIYSFYIKQKKED